MTDDYIAWVVMKEEKNKKAEFLHKVQIPWWRGGGYKLVFVHRLCDATLLSYHESTEICEMCENMHAILDSKSKFENKPLIIAE